MNTLQQRDTRSLSDARKFYDDSESLKSSDSYQFVESTQFSGPSQFGGSQFGESTQFGSDLSQFDKGAGAFNRLNSASGYSFCRPKVTEPRRGWLEDTLPLFQCYGIALLLCLFFPVTCGPMLGFETDALVVFLVLFMAYNRLSSVGRRGLKILLFGLAISFPFLVFYAATSQGQHQSQANHYYEIGQYQHAIDSYRADDADGISIGNNWLNYGDCYFKLGKFQKAVEYYTKASVFQQEKVDLERLPHHFGTSCLKEEQQNLAAVQFRLAKAYEKSGNKQQAQKYFKKAKEQGYKPASWQKELQSGMPIDETTHAKTKAKAKK